MSKGPFDIPNNGWPVGKGCRYLSSKKNRITRGFYKNIFEILLGLQKKAVNTFWDSIHIVKKASSDSRKEKS